jgi:hypothetical protein
VVTVADGAPSLLLCARGCGEGTLEPFARRRGEKLETRGHATILLVGGDSPRPGAATCTAVDLRGECRRVNVAEVNVAMGLRRGQTSRGRTLRFLAGPAITMAAVLTLSGCFTVRVNLDLQPDNTVDGSVVVGVDQTLAEAAGGEAALIDMLSGGDISLFVDTPDEGTVVTKGYHDNGRVGVEYVLSAVPITEFGGGPAGDFSIIRDGDMFIVDGVLDVRGGLGGQIQKPAGLHSADVSVSITFPGAVIETNGEVDGSTVTWHPQVGHSLAITAVGKVDAGLPIAWVLGLVVLILVVLTGLVIVLVTRRRRVDSHRASHGVLAADEPTPR